MGANQRSDLNLKGAVTECVGVHKHPDSSKHTVTLTWSCDWTTLSKTQIGLKLICILQPSAVILFLSRDFKAWVWIYCSGLSLPKESQPKMILKDDCIILSITVKRILAIRCIRDGGRYH